MIIKVYQVKDGLANKIYFPFLQDNDASAKRWFDGFVKSQNIDCSDLTLHKYGEYETETGLISMYQDREILAFGREFQEVQNEEKNNK